MDEKEYKKEYKIDIEQYNAGAIWLKGVTRAQQISGRQIADRTNHAPNTVYRAMRQNPDHPASHKILTDIAGVLNINVNIMLARFGYVYSSDEILTANEIEGYILDMSADNRRQALTMVRTLYLIDKQVDEEIDTG